MSKVALTADLIHGFTGSLLSSGFDEPAPTPTCHLEWWELCCSSHKRVAIAAPRGHAKSTAITKSYTLASVLFRSRKFVLVVSDTYGQASLFLELIKRELTANEDLIALFGIKGLSKDREDDLICDFKDGAQFRIKAVGSEQKVRGLLWNDMRPDLIVGDDLENDEIVMNPDRREKFRNWINNALLPCMSERGIVRFVGTILHLDSMLERLMPKDREANAIHEPLKVRMKHVGRGHTTNAGWMSVRYKAHDEGMENVLWPVKWTKKRLEEVRDVYVGAGNPEGYYQEYLNRPIDPHNAFFKKDDFQEFSDQDYERDWSYAPTYLSCDLALTTKERRDWCAFGIGSVDDAGVFYLRHVIRERQDSKDIVDTILRLQERYKFTTALIGKGAIEKSIGPFLRDELRRRGKFLHLEAIPEVIDKRQRAQPIRGRMRAGGVRFNKHARWYNDFEPELLEFDRGTYDDQVDMMSLFGMYLDQLQDAPTHKQIDDYLFEEEVGKAQKFEDHGRSLICGY